MQHPQIDFIAYGPERKVVLLAEAKSRPGTSQSWAAKLRRNMLAHGMLPRSQFFLIATPELMYVWRQEDLPPTEVQPQFLVDTRKALKSYFAKFEESPEPISPRAFELLIHSWLTDVAAYPEDQVEADPSLAPLVQSGLMSSLHNAQIESTTDR